MLKFLILLSLRCSTVELSKSSKTTTFCDHLQSNRSEFLRFFFVVCFWQTLGSVLVSQGRDKIFPISLSSSKLNKLCRERKHCQTCFALIWRTCFNSSKRYSVKRFTVQECAFSIWFGAFKFHFFLLLQKSFEFCICLKIAKPFFLAKLSLIFWYTEHLITVCLKSFMFCRFHLNKILHRLPKLFKELLFVFDSEEYVGFWKNRSEKTEIHTVWHCLASYPILV